MKNVDCSWGREFARFKQSLRYSNNANFPLFFDTNMGSLLVASSCLVVSLEIGISEDHSRCKFKFTVCLGNLFNKFWRYVNRPIEANIQPVKFKFPVRV